MFCWYLPHVYFMRSSRWEMFHFRRKNEQHLSDFISPANDGARIEKKTCLYLFKRFSVNAPLKMKIFIHTHIQALFGENWFDKYLIFTRKISENQSAEKIMKKSLLKSPTPRDLNAKRCGPVYVFPIGRYNKELFYLW